MMEQPSLHRLLDDVSDIPVMTDTALVRQKSRDFFWYSPVLNRQLRDCVAQAVISSRDQADVVRVAAACFRHNIPITPRGGGTGNYGQAVPLQGGVVLDMTRLDAIEWQRPGMLRVGPGRKMIDVDRETRPNGWELRMHPSTKRSATIGGFVAGGSGGVGLVTWGGLREPGNVAAARIVTAETTPRAIVPVAAVEQHGPHLPVSFDAMINAGIAARALTLTSPDAAVLTLPMQSVGLSVEHVRFPETLTLSAETLIAVLTEIGRSINRAGVRRVVFVNSHGGQPQVIVSSAGDCASTACSR